MSQINFVTFEGIDGCGKTTQAKLLVEHFINKGTDVVFSREPGGSPGAEAIRGLLLSGATDKWTAETELLLFTAARRDHLEKTIEPALLSGKMVICDRFADSTRVYQGATRGELRNKVDLLHTTMIGREPDLTIIIDVEPKIALERGLARHSGEDRFEDFGLKFQERLRLGFLNLVKEYPTRCHLIDGNRSTNKVFEDVLALAQA
ncbi:MAG: dTMP kinase [Planktomarina sp.]|jgi:dTMP kinase|nr:dTMP kinase [Planktomarina sp.]MDT2018066.1 dTMP kinase [Planktomarina sp.]MDV3050084.1 dTMP kinase [Planktomarina sp.]|tara:strand:+ start:385 stop:999 length:615 start_codon:yes stop_codon:yes gene_type:complete